MLPVSPKGVTTPWLPSLFPNHTTHSYVVVLQTDEIGEEWTDLQYNTEHEYSRDLNDSSEVSNSTWHYLKIKNTTSLSSGTYACIIRSPVTKVNQTSTVTLKVTDCPEDAKFQKYRTELVMLCSLGFFYLLLIFFACVSTFRLFPTSPLGPISDAVISVVTRGSVSGTVS
uniref:Ig-like domain-containing protein n=1 Tax=Podarcis muralis TaxID=64176 RepID=A0A670JWM2_PODMU